MCAVYLELLKRDYSSIKTRFAQLKFYLNHYINALNKMCYFLPPCAIQVRTVNKVELGISPVQFLQAVVQSEPVGPVNVSVDDNCSICAIHTCPFDLRDLSPIRPVHVPIVMGKEMKSELKH